jgi:hypothetical protein
MMKLNEKLNLLAGHYRKFIDDIGCAGHRVALIDIKIHVKLSPQT